MAQRRWAKTPLYALLVFNCLLILIGITCVIFAVWIGSKRSDVEALVTAGANILPEDAKTDLAIIPKANQSIKDFAINLHIAGGIAVLASFLGFALTMKQAKPLLVVYLLLLLIVMAIQLAVVIHTSRKHNQRKVELKSFFKETLQVYNGNGTDDMNIIEGFIQHKAVRIIWDKLMTKKQCCGLESKEGEFTRGILGDFFFDSHENKRFFPPACCPKDKVQDVLLVGKQCISDSRYKEGCFTKFRDCFDKTNMIIMTTLTVMVIIEVIGVVLCFWLCLSMF